MESRLSKLYRERFRDDELARKSRLWQVLCVKFFQKYIPRDSVVLDIGAGYCEFINNIRARKKYAVDLNEDVRRYAQGDVEVFVCSAAHIDRLEDGSVDVVFMSNFLEHLHSKDEVLEVLRESHRVLRDGGKVLIVSPNIRYAYKEYWDFFDHHTPLSDKSLAEALALAGFSLVESYAKFLPYTTKSELPQSGWLVKLYLKFPPIWWVMGKQFFAVARKQSRSR